MIYFIVLGVILIAINILLFKYNKYNNTKRESNLEFLRIISMFLIVAHHFALHGYDLNILEFSNKKIILDFLVLGGKVGVNIFILISSYYLVDREIKFKNLLKLIGKIKLYALLFLILAFVFDKNLLNLKTVLQSLFPIVYELYWFITCYIVLYILAPYLNLFLRNIEKEKLRKLLFILLFLYMGINIFMGAKLFFSELIWFVILYFIMYYIKNYFKYKQIKMKNLIYMNIFMYLCVYLSVLIFDCLGKYSNIFRSHSLYFIRENSIFSFIFSVGIFLIFLKLTLKQNKLVNYLASGTLGVYLIHENTFVREYLYQGILKNKESLLLNFLEFALHCILSLIFIFFGSLFLSKIIDFILDNLLLNYINFNKLENYLKNKIQKILNYINKFEN